MKDIKENGTYKKLAFVKQVYDVSVTVSDADAVFVLTVSGEVFEHKDDLDKRIKSLLTKKQRYEQLKAKLDNTELTALYGGDLKHLKLSTKKLGEFSTRVNKRYDVEIDDCDYYHETFDSIEEVRDFIIAHKDFGFVCSYSELVDLE